MRFRRIVEESEDALAWVKKMYGAKTAAMLQDYCAEKDKDINKVVWDEMPDRSGVTAWEKFENWAKSKRRTNVQKDRFGDTTIDDYLPSGNSRRGRLGKVYDEPSMSDMVAEATGKDEYAIADYVGNDLRHCSFVDNFCWGDYADMTFEIDGIKYRLSVERAPGEVNAFDDAI
jgi:hypothetical protein